MSLVTALWFTNAAIALALAGFCLLSWIVDRRNLANLAFCLIAVASAAAMPLELGMLNATTPAEFGEMVRWFHLPIFFVFAGHVLFVRYYLGAGRWWLMAAVIGLRLAVLVTNFAVHPNFNFIEITSLHQIPFLGEQVSVVSAAVMRPWQWIGSLSGILLFAFIVDAVRAARRRAVPEARRRTWVITLAILGPMTGNFVLNQLIVLGVLHIPFAATLWFLGTVVAIVYELGREFIASRRDQLKLAELQGRLAQFERVSSLGQLATGLVHELAQPLTATVNNSQAAELVLQQSRPDLDELRAIVADMHQDSRRASDLIDRMRALLQRRTVEMQPVPLEDIVQDVVTLARPQAATAKVTIECRVPAGLPAVLGDRVHLSQVLLNLLINGMEAVKSQPVAARRVVIECRGPIDGVVETAVTDSGPGVPAHALKHVFDPLYSTKTDGLGMGLALSRTIIEAHGGHLWAENASASGGAIFRFTLLQAQTPPVRAEEPESSASHAYVQQ